MFEKSFVTDEEKMVDFLMIPKNTFLASYSYLTEDDYEDTRKHVLYLCKKFGDSKVKMDYHLWQINPDRDTDNLIYDGSKSIIRKCGKFTVDMSIYDEVYQGEIETEDLEDIYRLLNRPLNKLENFIGRPMTVSDVLFVANSSTGLDGWWFCDNIGFKKF